VTDGKPGKTRHLLLHNQDGFMSLCGMMIQNNEIFLSVEAPSPGLASSCPPMVCPECFKVFMRMSES
jgi:hypothetical protein